MNRNTALTSTYINGFDKRATLSSQSLSKAHREPLRGVARGVLLGFMGLLCFMPAAGGSKPVQYIDYKTYALYLLDFNHKEHRCLLKLYGKESAWNPKAIGNLGGTKQVYGIPQGKSEYLARVDGYKQIQWGLKYIQHHRIYQGSVCKALDHWRTKGWH